MKYIFIFLYFIITKILWVLGNIFLTIWNFKFSKLPFGYFFLSLSDIKNTKIEGSEIKLNSGFNSIEWFIYLQLK